MRKLIEIISCNFDLIIPYNFPSSIKNSNQFFDIDILFCRFVCLFAYSIKCLTRINKHVAALLIRNRVVIVEFYQSENLFRKVSHNRFRNNASIKKFDKKVFVVVCLKVKHLVLFHNTKSINNFKVLEGWNDSSIVCLDY